MLRPLEDKIIVKVAKKAEQTTASGLVLAGVQEEKPDQAEVVAVGPGVTFPDGSKLVPDVKIGDKVVFAKYQGTEIEHEGDKLIILAYRDIIAVINE